MYMNMRKGVMSLSLIAIVTLCALNVAAASVSKPAIAAYGNDITSARAAQATTTLTFTAPANVKLNQNFNISGYLTSASGNGIAGAVVDEQTYYNGTWVSMFNVTTDNSGHLSDTWGLSQAGAYNFRLAYNGDSQNAASVSNEITITAS
jgi:hypothetical protein